MTELLSPAGNIEKLRTAFAYGADAVYLGLDKFSLRRNAGNFTLDDLHSIAEEKAKKPGRKVYLALNILFHEDQLRELDAWLTNLKDSPFDAFIISDIGAASLVKKHLPGMELHLSTQASCLNSAAARAYHDWGFSRIVLGREASLDDIKRIKDAAPGLETECFVHGAMCMAYSGRCMLSAHLAGRSANQGDCAHTCRWNFRLGLEEAERPGVWHPISEEDGYTNILSSKDLCMVGRLDDLVEAGVDSLKIEGRMKSVMYVAAVTRAYRKALDKDPDAELYIRDMESVSHREYTTGFYYGRGPIEGVDSPTSYGYRREKLFLGTVGELVAENTWEIDIRNQIRMGGEVEFTGPDTLSLKIRDYVLLGPDMEDVDKLDHMGKGYIKTREHIAPGMIMRADRPAETVAN